MATDYDAPRKNEDEVAEDSIEELKSRQEDEFTCSQCFLVHHASQLDHVDASGAPVCTECAM